MRIFIKVILRNVKLLRFLYLVIKALGYYKKSLVLILKKSWDSNELSTFTYSITNNNIKYLAHTLSSITDSNFSLVNGYIDEVLTNEKLKSYCLNGRIMNYVLIRLYKPSVVVENGIFIGFNSLIMCEAIKLNIEEGFDCEFIGLDIDKNAGELIRCENYAFAKIVNSDTIDFLNNNLRPIDFYFSDGDRRREYEVVEFETLKKSLNKKSFIISNKLAFSDALADFSSSQGRKFITYREEVLDHWYPGTLFGISYL